MFPTTLVAGTTLDTPIKASAGSRKGCPNYDVAFKRQLAELACNPDISVSQLAQAQGVSQHAVQMAQAISRWIL